MSEPILKTIYPASLVFKKHSVPKSRLFKICWDRELLLIRRNAFFYVFKTIQIIVVALIVSTVYLRTEMHAKVENDAALYIGALIYSMIANMFNGFAELPLMIQRLAVFYKQRDLLFHPPWTFTLPIWKELAPMNKPRHNFASAEIDGLVYVIRGFSRDGATLYNGEVYNPKTNQWRDFDCPNRPQWCTFAFSFGSKLNVVGGGSSFIDIYDPKTETWERQNLGQSWVGYSYTVLRNKVYFVDMCWSEYLRVFDPHDHSWSMVRLPPNYQGLMYKLDTWNNKVLLLSWHRGGVTLMYDSDEEEGSKWNVFDQMEPSARPLASVIINF